MTFCRTESYTMPCALRPGGMPVGRYLVHTTVSAAGHTAAASPMRPRAARRATRTPVGAMPLLPDRLQHEALRPLPVELRVEDALPRAEVEATRGDGHDHLVVDE